MLRNNEEKKTISFLFTCDVYDFFWKSVERIILDLPDQVFDE